MSDIDIDVDVDESDLEAVEEALEDALEDGMKEVAAWYVDRVLDEARRVIRVNDRIWNREVYHGFVKEERRSKKHGVSARLANYVPHVTIVNYGRAPGETRPQVQDIIEWVDDNVEAPQVDPNLENWDPELQALATQYSPGTVVAAFDIQDQIYYHGIDGIHFKEKAQSKVDPIAYPVTQRKVAKHMRKNLKMAGQG